LRYTVIHTKRETERQTQEKILWKELLMAAAARSALLNHLRLRVHVQAVPRNPSYTLSFNAIRRRFLSEEVRGSFLDKSEVADRVISVVKNFQKVDPSKVKYATSKIKTCNNLLLPRQQFYLQDKTYIFFFFLRIKKTRCVVGCLVSGKK
jgi:hypothetical protein